MAPRKDAARSLGTEKKDVEHLTRGHFFLNRKHVFVIQ